MSNNSRFCYCLAYVVGTRLRVIVIACVGCLVAVCVCRHVVPVTCAEQLCYSLCRVSDGCLCVSDVSCS